LDRISRNTGDYITIRKILDGNKVKIISTSERFEDTPAGRFMEHIISNVSEFDNDVRAERCINGMKDAVREEGGDLWRAPLGYSNVKIASKSTIEMNAQGAIVRRIFEEVAAKINSAETIYNNLKRENLLTLKSGKQLSLSHFYSTLNNKLYTGWIYKFGE